MTTLPFPAPPAHRRLYDEIARSHPSLIRGRVWCHRCGSFRDIDAARCLQHGWPKCDCGAGTMSIDKPKEAPAS